MEFELRAITDDEVLAYMTAVDVGFGGDMHPDDEAVFRSYMPLERTVAAFDHGEMVATLGDFPLRLAVPGGAALAMAGTTEVTVRATHRRRGILRSMIERHLEMAVDRSEPLAGLWASESAIYGRFGFGLAVEGHEISINSRLVSVPQGPDDISLAVVSADAVLGEIAPFWSSLLSGRAGWIDRSEARWKAIVDDPERRRDGASSMRHVVARRAGAVVGHIAYRQKSKWENDIPGGTVALTSFASADLGAHRALWHYVTNVDLFPHVNLWNAPLDDTVAMEASDLRQVRRRAIDTLYLRLLDVVTCLEARRYEVDDALTLGVQDALGHAAGVFEIEVLDGTAQVRPVDAAADVSLDIRELGALFLGRDCSDALARLGLLEGESAAVARLGRLFRTTQAPYCPEMF